MLNSGMVGTRATGEKCGAWFVAPAATEATEEQTRLTCPHGVSSWGPHHFLITQASR